MGVWLGIIERTEETIIGTPNGVIKCRTVNRMVNGEQWNPELVLGIRGLPWEPIPGKQSMRIPVDVNENGDDPEGDNGSKETMEAWEDLLSQANPTEGMADLKAVTDWSNEIKGGHDWLLFFFSTVEAGSASAKWLA